MNETNSKGLTDTERKILADVGVWTLSKIVKTWWAAACPACKKLAMSNPKGDMSQYCQACQTKYMEIAKRNVKQ